MSDRGSDRAAGTGDKRKRLARPLASGAPLYRQVVDTLRTEIQTGRYARGDRLPTESELCARFQVSRHTVREALRQLRDGGLVASHQGAGTHVLGPSAGGRFVHEVASINDLVAYADELRYVAESSGMIVADKKLAARLGCAVGQRWLRIEGFRYPQGAETPIAWTEVFIHADFAGIGIHVGRRPGPIYLWIEETYGQEVQEVKQIFTARTLPDAVASALGVESESTGIEVMRTYKLFGGAIAEIAFTLYPSDRFVHAMTLRRAKPDGSNQKVRP